MSSESQARVLVAEDDAALLRAYTRIISAAGHVVETATDGASALEAFRKQPFDVVISDIDMPRMDGIQLLRALREHDLDVPVVFVTAGPSVDSAVRAIEHGALRYLTKPVDIPTLQSVVARAAAMYRMAKLRRAALELVAQDKQIGDRAGLEVRFDSALRQLWMAYQPIVRWSTREVFAYEALVRSREPTLAHPGALFDAAERLGRLRDLGRAIRVLAPLPLPDAAPGVKLFINLHTSDLEDEALHSPDSALARIADRVVLEVTERASLDHVKDVRARVEGLRRLGYAIALDDIGAGYAGLTSFALLEPNVVKLDMSLVRNLHQEPIKQKLVASMASLCQSLDLLMVAEGVETSEELEVLVSLGCDLFQGYLFARPEVPFAQVKWPPAL